VGLAAINDKVVPDIVVPGDSDAEGTGPDGPGGRGRGRAKAGESCAGEGELRRPGSNSRRVLVLCHAQPPHSLVRIGPGIKCVWSGRGAGVYRYLYISIDIYTTFRWGERSNHLRMLP
jgi:hypothetical protein